jgi:hypothetical protein
MPAVRTLDDVVALYEATTPSVRPAADDVDDRRSTSSSDAVARVGERPRGRVCDEKNERRADIRPTMPETKTYTDEQRRKFAEATGLELDKVTDEMLAKAGVPRRETPADDDATSKRPTSGPTLEQRARSETKKRRELEAELRDERRATSSRARPDGKIEPGRAREVGDAFDKDPSRRAKLRRRSSRTRLLREYGSDEETSTDEQREPREVYEDDAQRLGVPKEAML